MYPNLTSGKKHQSLQELGTWISNAEVSMFSLSTCKFEHTEWTEQGKNRFDSVQGPSQNTSDDIQVQSTTFSDSLVGTHPLAVRTRPQIRRSFGHFLCTRCPPLQIRGSTTYTNLARWLRIWAQRFRLLGEGTTHSLAPTRQSHAVRAQRGFVLLQPPSLGCHREFL